MFRIPDSKFQKKLGHFYTREGEREGGKDRLQILERERERERELRIAWV